MPDATPAFLVVVAYDGTIICKKHGTTTPKEMPGALDFLAWLTSNGFSVSLWTARTGDDLDAAVEWLAAHGIAEESLASIGLDAPEGATFGAAVTAAAAGFPLVRGSGSALIPDWDRIRSDLLVRRAWRDEGVGTEEPALYLSPATAPVPKMPRRRAKPPAAVFVASDAAANIANAASALSSNIETAIKEAAVGPKSVTVDGQTVVAHDLDDLIEADRYLASKQSASGNPFAAIRPCQMAHSGPR
jgi:hypothetical protein